MAVRYIRVKVNSNLKHSQASPRCIDFSYTKTFGEAIADANIVLKRTGAWGTDDNDFVTGKRVQVWMSDTLTAGEVVENSTNIVFDGYITNPQFDSWKTVINCSDRLILAKWQETGVVKYSGSTIKTIWQAIIDRIESQSGLTFNTSINAATPSPSSLSQYVLENNNCYEKLWELANIVGWQFYYDVTNDVVVFEPKGTPTNQEFANKVSYGAVWTGKTVNVVGLMSWSSNSDDLTNDFVGIGGQTEITITNEVHATVGTLYTLNAGTVYPYNVTVQGSTDGGGTYPTTFTHGTDYAVASNAIAFLDSTFPGSYTHIRFTYTYKLSASGQQTTSDATSISNYIKRSKTVTKRNIVNSTDVTNYLTTLLSGFKDPFTEISFEVNDTLIVPTVGAKVSIYDGVIGRQALYTDTPYPFIVGTTKRWPSPTTSVKVSTKPLKYEERDQTIFDKLDKVDKELTKTNEQSVIKLGSDNKYSVVGDIQINQKQLITPIIHNLSTAPLSPLQGQMYFNTTVGDKTMYYYNGSSWVGMTTGTGTQNRLTKWATTTTLGDSLLIDNGSNLAFKYASYSGTGAHISNDVNGTIIITVPSGQKVKFVAA